MSDPVPSHAHYDGAHGVACMDAMRNMLDRDLSGAVVPMSAAAVYWWGCAEVRLASSIQKRRTGHSQGDSVPGVYGG